MLSLTREVDQVVNLHIGKGQIVRVMLLAVEHGRARIGFDAPANVKILREEIDQSRLPKIKATR